MIIPKEVVVTIFMYFDQNQLSRCARVCKLFAKFARSILYRRIELSHAQSPKLLNCLILNPYLSAYAQHISIVLSRYRHFEIDKLSTFVGKICQVLRLANNMEYVSFTESSNDDVTDIFACEKRILAVLAGHKNLRSVQLRLGNIMRDKRFVQLIKLLGKERELALRIPAPTFSLPRFINSLKNLICLEIYQEGPVEVEQNWGSILSSISLEAFAIDSLVFTSLPNVTRLKLTGKSTMTACAWEVICQLPSLETLYIEYFLDTSEAGLETFSSARFMSHSLRCLTLQSPEMTWKLLVFPILNVCKGLVSISLFDRHHFSLATLDNFWELWSKINRIAGLTHFCFSVDHLTESYGHLSPVHGEYSLLDISLEATMPSLETITIVFPSEPVTLRQCQTLCDRFPSLKKITFRLSYSLRMKLFNNSMTTIRSTLEGRSQIPIVGPLVDATSPCLSQLYTISQGACEVIYFTLDLWRVRKYLKHK
jgi:hypothetical protein